MNWLDIFVWGPCATAAMTSIEAIGPALGWSRLSTPVLLGTLFVPDRDRALLIGLGIHLVLGWAFALLYAAVFEAAGAANWWFGAGIGVGHQLFLLTAVYPSLPAAHPRLTTERHGPTPTRALQAPGFFALNYGRSTVVVGLAAYAAFGAILGATYSVNM